MDMNWRFNRLGILVFVVLYFQSFVLCWSLNNEGLALLRLRERVVRDPFGALSNWRENNEGEVDDDPCSWFGVECSNGYVIVLNLKDLCLEGTLAPDITNLLHIKSIILRNNSFTGIIPEELRELKELEVLDLGWNNFTGPVPHDLGSNLSLAILLLDNNELLGVLSPEIYELQMLSESQVDENQLSNTAKGSACKDGLITRNVVQSDDTIHRRVLRMLAASSTMVTIKPPPSEEVAPHPSSFSPSSSPFPSGSADTSLGPTPPQTSPPPLPALVPSSSEIPTMVVKSSSTHSQVAILAGAIGGAVFIFLSIIGIYLYRTNKNATVKPWATGLSGQLRKAFITGVPKLNRSELDAACEDFSNVIGSSPIGMVYKGTLSNGVEIAVASVEVTSAKDWSINLEAQFSKKIDTLSKVNHKNFVNLLGYCEEEEPFTRMMVFEYASNGTLFEHLHVKESEHLDWGMRLRIAMGMAYCLEYMHQLNPPIAHNNLTSSSVYLSEDYAAKISDFSFWNEIALAEMEAAGNRLSHPPLTGLESNIYSFGILLFEMVTGKLPYAVESDSLEDWAADYLRGEQTIKEMVDPTLNSFEEEQLVKIGNLVKSCVHPDPKQRPVIAEITARLREITGISPEEAIPKISPLWWAELEILSTEAT
ncbi:Pkinase_Tyr domain-containing protein/LRRNT_2 domain-containing protein [Cephalotus follicularis]|uniref:Pkinase_Tyr domain-containing protein/LRRNT_2 domain-containing protein n=1 Tax=Cephalotus follicularis TaxID=3775 RepID=A0A1Q3D6H2_CEPFO|nr:Pkinase_Tyr domain-containing protein/LRRNT_2 domain-containing protein [Cephalotus follicularis]